MKAPTVRVDTSTRCSRCKRWFGGMATYERHRKGSKCLDPATIVDEHGQPVMAPMQSRHPAVYWGLRHAPRIEGELTLVPLDHDQEKPTLPLTRRRSARRTRV